MGIENMKNPIWIDNKPAEGDKPNPDPPDPIIKPDIEDPSPPSPRKNRKILYAGIAAAAIIIIGLVVILNRRDVFHINKGISLYIRHEYEKAKVEFEKAISINPKSSDAYSWRGASCFRKLEYDTEFEGKVQNYIDMENDHITEIINMAIEDQKKAIKNNPDNALAYSRYALYSTYKGIPDDAIINSRKALELDDQNALILTNCGRVDYNFRQIDEAEKKYTRAIEINPNYLDSYFNRGYVYALKGMSEMYIDKRNMYFEKAVSDFGEVILKDQNNAIGYCNRGYANYLAGKYDKALLDFNEAITLNDKYIRALFWRGMTYGIMYYWEKAYADFNKLVLQDPANYDVLWNRAHASFILAKNYPGQYELAIEDCNNAIELKPGYPFAYIIRAEVNNELRNFKEAMDDCNKVLSEMDPQNTYARAHLARAYFGKEDYVNAKKEYENAVNLDSEQKNYFAYIGMFYIYGFVLWDYDNALINLEKAYNITPYRDDKHILLNYKAMTYFYLGRFDEALSAVNGALEALHFVYMNDAEQERRRRPDYIDTRGTIYRALKMYNEAIENYSEAIKSNSAVIYMNRAITYQLSGDQISYEKDKKRAEDISKKEAALAWVDIGINQLQAGMFDEASKSAKAAREIYPESEEARKLLTLAQAKKKKSEL